MSSNNVKYVTKRSVIGFLVGAALGMSDALVFRLLGVEMMLGDYDATLAIVAFFALNFGVLGATIGHLLDQREVISEQITDLEQARKRAIQQEKLAAVGRLASSVAHEVRNPLGVIRSSAAMLGEDADPSTDDARAARFITEEVDRLDRFVRRVLDFTRPLELDAGPVRLDSLLESVTQGHDGVEIELDDGSVELRIDEALLVQALRNLITNARDAGQRVTLGARRMGDDVVFEVCDDGPGVDDAAVDQLFEPFFTTRATGTGLGLSMARKIVELHSGELRYLPNRGLGPNGQGACFEMRIPA